MKRLSFFILFTLITILLFAEDIYSVSAIKVEFGGTSMIMELSQQPKIISEGGNLVVKTNSTSVTLSLPCKVTPIEISGTAIKNVAVRNNNDNTPINVFTFDGKKVATLKDKKETLNLQKGMYIINGKKVFIK